MNNDYHTGAWAHQPRKPDWKEQPLVRAAAFCVVFAVVFVIAGVVFPF